MDNSRRTKEITVENEYAKCKRIIDKTISNSQHEKSIAAISIAGFLLYSWNQKYADDYLEDALQKVAISTITPAMKELLPEKGVVLFYDGFGYDTRGLAQLYLKALATSGYKVIYIIPKSMEGQQPAIDRIISNSRIIKEHYSTYNYMKKMSDLQKLICVYRPAKAFLYTYPSDAVGIIVFSQMRNTTRYLINLTDHAFWLGTKAVDYCVEFRNYGASISHYYRNIPSEKIVLLPFYPVFDKDVEFKGFPFNSEGKQIIFSGGALYKTIDEHHTYYRIVDSILASNQETVFVYAGSGENPELTRIIKKYPKRAYQIDERSDLYQVLKHSTLYLNTYPLLGGLMTQYAAIAGRIPITLTYDDSGDGLLINQHEREICYETVDDLLLDVNKLLADEQYLHTREKKLEGAVITPEAFQSEIMDLLNNGHTSFRLELAEVNTVKFRADYIDRFQISEFRMKTASICNTCLFLEYKESYLLKITSGGISKIVQAIRKRMRL